MKVPCYFCHAQFESNQIAGDIYKCVCDTCPEICTTIHKMTPTGVEFWCAAIAFEDKGKEYRAYYHPSFFYIDLLEVSEVDGRMQQSKRVMELSFCPKRITPNNIKKKFATLVVWS
jgi:hypothetical protein